MKKILLLILGTVFLAITAGCNAEKPEENSSNIGSTEENQPSPEELKQEGKILLPIEEQIKLKQKISAFFGSEEAFLEHGFAYIDEKQNNKGVIGIKGLNSTETEKLQKQIYQEIITGLLQNTKRYY